MIRKRIRAQYSARAGKNKLNKWLNRLYQTPCFIIGNSPSLDDFPICLLNGLFTIGVNRAFKKIHPTILLWQDIELFYSCRDELANLKKTLLYARDIADPFNLAYHFKLLNTNYKLTNNASILAGRGSSMPLAYQLAHILGCNPIIFLGYDCKYRDGKTDFWGVNRDHRAHTLTSCSRGMNWIINFKESHNLIFCSPSETAINIMSLEKALKICKITKESYKNNQYYINKLLA